MGTMSIGHWLIVLLVVLLVFGPKRLGNIGKGLGEGMRGLREGLAGKGEDAERSADEAASAKQIPGNPSTTPRDTAESGRSA